jgi:hypothetical protein
MRRPLTILLFFIYLIGSTEAYQLLKVPSLVVHYFKHCKEDPNTTIQSFLVLHYQEKTVYDSDWQQDMQLPFKTHEDDLGLMALCYYPPVHVTSLKVPIPMEPENQYPARHEFEPGCYAADIFQPPKS